LKGRLIEEKYALGLGSGRVVVALLAEDFGGGGGVNNEVDEVRGVIRTVFEMH
jgi:hypothetical protein